MKSFVGVVVVRHDGQWVSTKKAMGIGMGLKIEGVAGDMGGEGEGGRPSCLRGNPHTFGSEVRRGIESLVPDMLENKHLCSRDVCPSQVFADFFFGFRHANEAVFGSQA